MRRIGILVPGEESDPEYERRIGAFREGLQQFGWSIGKNMQIDYRWAAGNPDRMNAFASELIQFGPDVIFTNGTGPTAALQRQTRSVPIVFAVVSDPIGDGFVSSLAHPGGNITGFSTFDPEIGGKWLGLLKEFVPTTARVGLLFNPKTAPGGGSFFRHPSFEAAARSLDIQPTQLPVQSSSDIDEAIAKIASDSKSALIVSPDTFTTRYRDVIIGGANRHRLPAIYPFRVFAEAGGLMVYGVEVVDLNRRAASYVDRILKGERAADLPVQAPTRFEFVINLKIAKGLGLEVPPMLLARADEVIE
jgi:putative ABC transport system substrate-binding protein